jgi:hypothetical protein
VTIQDLGSIGELVAAVATVVTLAYLALQIRANTTAIRAEGRRAATAVGTAMRVAIAQDGELARIFNAGLADYSKLTPEEKTRFVFALSDFVTAASSAYEEVVLGVQSQSDIANQSIILGPFLNTPGGRDFWRLFADRYPAPFKAWVDQNVLKEHGSSRRDPKSAA